MFGVRGWRDQHMTTHVGPSRKGGFGLSLSALKNSLLITGLGSEILQKGKKNHPLSKLVLESPRGTCTSPSYRHKPRNTHLGTLSRLPTQTCWGGTIFHFLASTTIASASTSPKPYRWLTGKREDSETPSLPSRDQELLLGAWRSILQPSGKVWS